MPHCSRYVGASLVAALLTGCGGAHDNSILPGNSVALSPQIDSAQILPDAAGTSTVLRHVMTAYYLGAPFGSTSISPSRAAPYLSWTTTGIQNTNAMAAAGIKTMMYADADRQTSNSPLFHAGEAAFAHSCSGARITDFHDNVTQYLMEPGSATFRAAFAAFIRARTAGHPLTAVYEDDSVAPSYYARGFFKPSLPCKYSDASWQANEKALLAGLNQNTIVSGLVSRTSWALLDNPSTIGGNIENCYVTAGKTTPEEVGPAWVNIQNTHLYVVNRHKYFECMGLDKASAASAIRSRLYELASFLMVYNPAYSILWETYATPSLLSVMPETQLVALNPIVPSVSSVASLRSSTGAYVREYRQCAYAGRVFGACAVVVNPESVAYRSPHFTFAYRHTLALRGYGVLDGGTATLTGAAPPATVAAVSGYIAVP